MTMLLGLAACAGGPGALTSRRAASDTPAMPSPRIAVLVPCLNEEAAIGKVIAGLGHDIRNMLTALKGGMYLLDEFIRDAEQSFERALNLAPNDADINHNYGVFLCQTKREPDSIRYFMHAIKNPLYATPWRSYSAAGVCTLRTGQAKDAEQYFERALRLEPDETAALINLGQIRYKQGKMDEARRLVSRYNKLADPSAESLWLALRIERRSGERVAEQSYANQLRRRFPGSAEYQALQRGKFD